MKETVELFKAVKCPFRGGECYRKCEYSHPEFPVLCDEERIIKEEYAVIESLTAQLAQKDSELAETKHELDGRISRCNECSQDHSRSLKFHTEQLSECANRISGLEDQLAQKDGEIAELENTVEYLKDQLTHAYQNWDDDGWDDDWQDENDDGLVHQPYDDEEPQGIDYRKE